MEVAADGRITFRKCHVWLCQYKPIDPFCLFYLHFVKGGNQENDKYWQQNIVSQPVSIWRGFKEYYRKIQRRQEMLLEEVSSKAAIRSTLITAYKKERLYDDIALKLLLL